MKRKKKRVVLHDYGGYPFIFDISTELASNDIEVYHIYSSASGSPNGSFANRVNLSVIDLGKDISKVEKASFVKRFFQEWSYGNLLTSKIAELQPDLVFSSNTPLLAQIALINYCKKNEIYVIHWLQDLLSLAAGKVLSKKNKMLGIIAEYFFRFIERRCLNLADLVISISEDFNRIVSEWGVSSDKIILVENWAQVREIALIPKLNDFCKEYNLENTFNMVYTGTLGLKQNPQVLVDIAQNYLQNENVKVLVIAAGEGMTYLQNEKMKRNLSNLICLPLQPYENLPKILGTADLLIATLNEDAGDYCVPSKVLTYYCAGKPSLLIMPMNNQAVRITQQNDLGICVAPSDLVGLKSMLDYYLEYPSELSTKGTKARLYAEENFLPEIVVKHFLKIIDESNTH